MASRVRSRALRSTGRAPAEARLASLADVPAEAFLAVVCLPQENLPELLTALSDRGCRAVNLVGGGAPLTRSTPGRHARYEPPPGIWACALSGRTG